MQHLGPLYVYKTVDSEGPTAWYLAEQNILQTAMFHCKASTGSKHQPTQEKGNLLFPAHKQVWHQTGMFS